MNIFARRGLGEPVPPRNVRIRKKDGRVLPVELVYQGVDYTEGYPQHLWLSTARYQMVEGDAVLEDLPADPNNAIVILNP